jgi:uncharacterized protein YecE (DUF72 family)
VHRIRVGTASWTDRTLLESGWYPADADTPERRLEHYARCFPVVEVDSTYYTPPNERNSTLWAQRTPEGFSFHVKAFSLLTQHPTRAAALYKDLRPAASRETVTLDDLDAGVVEQVWERFLSALAPLHEAGKLGAVLFQFPPWFAPGARRRRYVLECQERCAPYRICVEVRNAAWMSGDAREETLSFLCSAAIPYVCVDMPQGHRSSVPPVAAVTGDLAVVRFHGRGHAWGSRDIREKFGYRYSTEELREWVPRLRHLAERADVHAFLNNCCGDNAQVNARQLADLLDEPA